MKSLELMSLLGRFSPFDGLSNDYLERVAEHSSLVNVEKGKLIFRRGKESDHRYYLVSGAVDLVGASFKTSHLISSHGDAQYPLSDCSPSKVSAVAKEDCRIIKVEADFLDIAMAWSQSTDAMIEIMVNEDVEHQVTCDLPDTVDLATAHVVVEDAGSGADWMSCLLQSSQFMRIPSVNIQKLFQSFEAVPVKTGDIVVKEGALGDYFYIIERGQAQVTKLVGNLDITLEAGSYFGEDSLVTNAPRNASITMLTDGLVMRIDKENFTTLMHQPAQRHLTFDQISSAGNDPVQLVDVRMPVEYQHHHVPDSINIPINKLRKKIPELHRDTLYLVTDDGGRRSELATYLMCQMELNACLLKNATANYPGEEEAS